MKSREEKRQYNTSRKSSVVSPLSLKKKAELYTYYIARAYSALDRHVEAIRSYEEVIRIKPDLAEAWYNKGISLRTLGEQKDADQCFIKAEDLGLKP